MVFLVPPRWTVEPIDQNAVVGHGVSIACQAEGFPIPTVTWKQSIGKSRLCPPSIHRPKRERFRSGDSRKTGPLSYLRRVTYVGHRSPTMTRLVNHLKENLSYLLPVLFLRGKVHHSPIEIKEYGFTFNGLINILILSINLLIDSDLLILLMDRYDVSRMDFEYFYRERERSVVSIFSRFFQIRVFLNYYGIFLATLVG